MGQGRKLRSGLHRRPEAGLFGPVGETLKDSGKFPLPCLFRIRVGGRGPAGLPEAKEPDHSRHGLFKPFYRNEIRGSQVPEVGDG